MAVKCRRPYEVTALLGNAWTWTQGLNRLRTRRFNSFTVGIVGSMALRGAIISSKLSTLMRHGPFSIRAATNVLDLIFERIVSREQPARADASAMEYARFG